MHESNEYEGQTLPMCFNRGYNDRQAHLNPCFLFPAAAAVALGPSPPTASAAHGLKQHTSDQQKVANFTLAASYQVSVLFRRHLCWSLDIHGQVRTSSPTPKDLLH